MLRVRILRDHRQLFAGSAAQVILPSEDGEISVLDFHAPMLCTLTGGDVRIDKARVRVCGGIARVVRNVVTIVAR